MNKIFRDYITQCIIRSVGLMLWLIGFFLLPVYSQTNQSGDIFEYIGTIELEYKADWHQITINLSGFQRGVYFVEIHNNFFSQIKKSLFK
jgi:hypothetical protein